jgi:hypothetical protein
MAIKSDRWIREMAQTQQMIDPFCEKQMREGVISYGLSSYGYDLRVADEFKIFTNVNSAVVDPKKFDERSFVSIRADSIMVPPNSFALARSVEYFKIPRDVLAICLGKSTYARCGIIVNVTRLSRSGRALSPWRSATPRRCPPRFTPTRASARFCSSNPMKLVRFPTRTKKGNTRPNRASSCRGSSKLRKKLSSTGTLACAVFAIAVESVAYVRRTKPHRQECLCY